MGLMAKKSAPWYTSLSLYLDSLIVSALCQVPLAGPLRGAPSHTHTLIAQFTCIILVMQWWVNGHPTLCAEAEREMERGGKEEEKNNRRRKN